MSWHGTLPPQSLVLRGNLYLQTQDKVYYLQSNSNSFHIISKIWVYDKLCSITYVTKQHMAWYIPNRKARGNYLHSASIGRDGGSRWLKQGPGDDICLGLSLLYNCVVHEDSTLWSYLGGNKRILRYIQLESHISVSQNMKHYIISNAIMTCRRPT